jgi:hypothetical protein
MRRQYLHLCPYACDKCGGPVIAGTVAVRENDISKETESGKWVQSACCAAIGKATRPPARLSVICYRLNGTQ